MTPIVTRAAVSVAAEKINHGFWTGIGITMAISFVGWGKFMVAEINDQINWGKTLHKARERPHELFENPKRAK